MPVKFETFDSELMESLCAKLLTPKELGARLISEKGK